LKNYEDLFLKITLSKEMVPKMAKKFFGEHIFGQKIGKIADFRRKMLFSDFLSNLAIVFQI